jgi:flagellar basal body L-ring protein FlgH
MHARGAGDVITITVDIEAARKARPNAAPGR